MKKALIIESHDPRYHRFTIRDPDNPYTMQCGETLKEAVTKFKNVFPVRSGSLIFPEC